MIALLTTFVVVLSTIQSSFQNSAPYYGVPVGSLFNAVDGTQGEIYAADSRTLTVVHFHHNAQPGCTSFMVGPPKADQPADPASTNRDGLTLTVKSEKHSRSKRQHVARQPLVPQIAANNPNPQEKKVQDPFNVELDDSELDNVTIPYVSPDPEVTYNFVHLTAVPEAPVTRIRTMHVPTDEPSTASPIPEILNETSTVQTSTSTVSSSSRKESTVTSSYARSSSSKPVTQISARRTTVAEEPPKNSATTSGSFGGFIEELSVDELNGAATKKWTLPPNVPISSIPVLPGRSRSSVVLHNKNPVIISNNSTQDGQGPFILVSNGNNSVSKHIPLYKAAGSGSGDYELGGTEKPASAEEGSSLDEVPSESGSGLPARSVTRDTSASGSGSGEDEYEEESTEAPKTTEKSGIQSNRTFAQRIFARGSTTESPHSQPAKSRKSTQWSSVPIISTTQKSTVEKPQESRRQNQQKEKPKEKSSLPKSQEKSKGKDGDAAGGIVWFDHTRSPAARQRGEDIRNAAEHKESIYTVHKGQTAAPVAGGGISWGAGSVKPQSRFWGPLPREPTEYFGGLNIPDDEEGKGPGLTVEPPITRRNKNSNRRTGNEGVTFAFGFGSAAEAPAPSRQDRPNSERSERPSNVNVEKENRNTVQFGSSSSSRGAPSSRLDNGPPAGPAPPAPRDPISDRRAEIQAERRAQFGFGRQSLVGVSDGPSSSSSSVSSTTQSSASKSLQSTTLDPNALFHIVEDPRHRTLPPFVPPPVAKPTDPPAAPRDWVVVEDRQSQRKPKPNSNAQPPLANLILSKDSTNVETNFGKERKVEEVVTGSLPSKDIHISSDKNTAADMAFYSLPKSQDDTLTVTLPAGMTITDFQWFGVYDHCQKQRTSFVTVNQVHPPQPVEIDGLKGWKYDVNSAKIRVMNCNTLMIKDFMFSGFGQIEAYFYVGSGDFPKNIVRKTRAHIVGPMRDDPLHNYKGEDALVRLPDGLKTFDINWIAVYNEKDNISYGHALIPPLVVPPCDS